MVTGLERNANFDVSVSRLLPSLWGVPKTNFEVCLPRCVNKLNGGCTVKHNSVRSEGHILELKVKNDMFRPFVAIIKFYHTLKVVTGPWG